MNTEHDTPIRARIWVNELLNAQNELVVKVGETFEFLLHHTDEFEDGSISAKDLPHFNYTTNQLLWYCVFFGMDWASANTTLFVITDDTDSFVGAFGHEENAINRAADEPRYSVNEFEIDAPPADETIQKFRDRDEKIAQQIADTFEGIHAEMSRGELKDFTMPDLPHFDESTNVACVYGVLFGILWEYSYPGVFALLTESNQVIGLYSNPGRALKDKTDVQQRSQRISIIDGDVPPGEILEIEV